MVVLKASVKRILSLLLLTVVLTAIPCVALAANNSAPTDDAVIDFNATGSITVTKYATADTVTAENPAGTGMAGQSPNEIYRRMEGVTFKLFKIADADEVKAYYDGTSTTTYELAKFVYNTDGTATYDGEPITVIKEGVTKADGTYKFADLPVGIYVLKEVTAPTQIVAPLAEDSMISVPMVNTATSSNNENAKWVYDVYVYPKNKASTGTVELTKQGQNDSPLKNVTFELYKKDFGDNDVLPTDWTQVTSAGEQSLSLITDEQGKLTLANLPAGKNGTQYKLVEISAPAGYIVNQTPLYFKVNRDFTLSWNSETEENGDCNNKNSGATAEVNSTKTKLSITLGNEQPSLIKHVKQNGGDTWKTDEQYRLDDEITYRLTVYVPNNVAELGTFEIKDVPQGGITDSGDSGDYTVTYGDSADACDNPLTADNYTLTKIEASGNNGQGFKLELNSTGKGLVAGKFIQIVYKAHMNANAVIAGKGNGNTATLTYSKYIGVTDTTTYAITDEARVYTYQYQITKRKDSAQGAVVGGVEFNLLYSETGTPVEVYKETDGVYRLWLTSDTETTKKTTTLTTKSDGTILLKGLENGTYYLKETKTIEGYNLLSAPFQIQLNVTEKTTWAPGDWATNATQFTATGRTVKTYQSTSYDVTDAKGTSTIINKKGFVLPQTGGMGYLLFCAVGIALIGGGAALIFGGRKKKIR